MNKNIFLDIILEDEYKNEKIKVYKKIYEEEKKYFKRCKTIKVYDGQVIVSRVSLRPMI